MMNSTFYIASLDREQFLSWIGKSYEPIAKRLSSVNSLPSPVRNGVVLVWKEKPARFSEVQPVIIVEDRALRDFFAFTTTYLPSYSPFTAFFRVATPASFSDLVGTSLGVSNGIQLPETSAAITIAEMYVQSKGAASLDTLTVQGCLATLSFAMMSALRLETSSEDFDAVGYSWQKMRRLLQDEAPQPIADDIIDFWKLVRAATQPFNSAYVNDTQSRVVVEFLRTTLIDRSISHGSWSDLTVGLPDIRNILSRFAGTREERVLAFDEATQILSAADHVDKSLRSVVAGALLAELGDGTLEYMGLADPIGTLLPTTPLWFVLFASLKPSTNALTAGNCLGRRVARSIYKNFDLFSAPVADISLPELEIRLDERNAMNTLRTEYQAIVSVEMMLGVVSRFRLSKGRSSENGRNSDRLRLREIRHLLRRVERLLDDSDPGEQQELSLGSSKVRYNRYRSD